MNELYDCEYYVEIMFKVNTLNIEKNEKDKNFKYIYMMYRYFVWSKPRNMINFWNFILKYKDNIIKYIFNNNNEQYNEQIKLYIENIKINGNLKEDEKILYNKLIINGPV